MALDSNARPYVAYQNATPYTGDLKLAHFDGTNWIVEVVDASGETGFDNSIRLDSQDHPYVSYYNRTTRDLRLAHYNGISWTLQVVDSVGDVGSYTSLALDAAGRPHIAYHDGTNTSLKYARFDGTSWSITTVDNSALVGRYASLALDAAGNPHIAYYDVTNGNLRYAYSANGGMSWQIVVVAQQGDVGQYASLALDSAGYPHIAYYDDTNGILLHSWKASCQPVTSADFDWTPAGPVDGELVTFTASSQPTATPEISYSWDLGDGTTASGPVVTHAYSAGGNFDVTLTVRNCQDQGSVVAQHTVGVTACTRVDIAEIVGQVNGCLVAFSAGLVGTAPLTYAWDFGAFGTSAAPNPTVDFGLHGTFPVALTVSNCHGLGGDTLATTDTTACLGPHAIFIPLVTRGYVP
jgi:PKD repeat protein